MRLLTALALISLFLVTSAPAAQKADRQKSSEPVYLESEVIIDPLEQIARDRNGIPITGVMQSFYPNGRLAWQTEWLDGKLHGVTRGYYENRQLMEETTWVNGKMHGPAAWYDEHGKLRRETMYNNDQDTAASAGKGEAADLPGGQDKAGE